MLQIDYTDDFPWCVSLDDLEAFILTLSKRSNRIQSFLIFLEHRQNYHGHLICSDELELCGSFLISQKKFIEQSQREETIVTMSDLTEPIEKAYRDGMGFDNERYFERKKKKDAHFLYFDTKKNTSR